MENENSETKIKIKIGYNKKTIPATDPCSFCSSSSPVAASGPEFYHDPSLLRLCLCLCLCLSPSLSLLV